MAEKNTTLFKYEYIEGLLSIVIVAFNSGDYLFEAIDSVIKQDYPKMELIISDDGTKNFDEGRIRTYIDDRRKDNLIKYKILHREKNVGTVRNINKALHIVQGEYIKILGGDDAYPSPDLFSNQVKQIRSSDALIAIGKAQQCDCKMNPIMDERIDRSNAALPKVLKMDYREARKYISKKDIFPIAIQAVCYHRNFFLKRGFCDEDYILIDDAPTALMILKEAKRVSYVDEYTVNHRAKVGISSSKELFAPRRLLYYKDCITFAKKEVDRHPEIYSFFYRKENIRINKFVYEAAKLKSENKNIAFIVLLAVKYIDAIIYYITRNPKKFWKRIVARVS